MLNVVQGMNGASIKVISLEKGVMVSHPKGHSLVKTNEQTFRTCYEWSLLLADFYPAKAELNEQSYQMDDAISAQIQTELVLMVLEWEFASPWSKIPKAPTPLAARALLKREMFRGVWLHSLGTSETARLFPLPVGCVLRADSGDAGCEIPRYQ
ncbi:MAG: hypothetical protein K0Q55_3104 [Verrucomicrobia bacterium]|jgi:hypothetical protein|nr:hypothetical protein [Verrucomicrobiota bacterium]